MKIAKIYFSDNLSISIYDDSLINGQPLSERAEQDMHLIISQNETIEIEDDDHYFFNSSKVAFIKMLKTK